MKYKKLNILVDLDSISNNLLVKWLSEYNRDYDDNLTPDDIMSWDTHLYVKPECGKKIYGYFTPELFLDLDPLEGAVEAIKTLFEDGHNITFVTATPWGCADAKYTWCRKHFPFLTSHDVIMAHKKYLVNGDVLIDDSPKNIREFRGVNGSSVKIYTIAYPYNKDVTNLCDLRLGSWRNPKEAWEGFTQGIKDLAADSYVPPKPVAYTD